ncbi:MAG TPA: cytidylate kinase-like family protein [Pirellulaceae bacterium]|nr:cytidylate kinase-like family protein [Pirellulaceae bacterium]
MSNHHFEVERRAEMNIRRWLSTEHAAGHRKPPHDDESVGPYVTISREVGAGGCAIARGVGRELGWEVLDREIINVMADRYGMPHETVELLDEKHPTWIEDWFASMFAGQRSTGSSFIYRLKRTLLLAGQHGNVVIVGRGAQFILPRDRGISVRILAPRDFRVEQVLLQKGISEREASKYVDDHDRQHEQFTREFLHHDATDPHMYDLVINVEKLVVADAVRLIVDATRAWLLNSTDARATRVSA